MLFHRQQNTDLNLKKLKIIHVTLQLVLHTNLRYTKQKQGRGPAVSVRQLYFPLSLSDLQLAQVRTAVLKLKDLYGSKSPENPILYGQKATYIL